MDALRTLLDIELLLSAAVHDLRGPMTALAGAAEIAPEVADILAATRDRLALIERDLSDRIPAATHSLPWSALVPGVQGAVQVTGAPTLLELALADLAPARVRVSGDALIVEGVPAAECIPGWNLRDVRRWRATPGGPGHLGARVRVAGRILGSVRQSVAVAGESGEIVLRFALSPG